MTTMTKAPIYYSQNTVCSILHIAKATLRYHCERLGIGLIKFPMDKNKYLLGEDVSRLKMLVSEREARMKEQ